MFDSLQHFFSEPAKGQSSGDEELRVATCVLLLETAYADRDFSSVEKERITGIISRRFSLTKERTAELLAAADQERKRRDDLYHFARLVNEKFTRPRKLAIIELLWEVVYSDQVLEAHEDALMHKLGNLLGVRRDELIALKLKVKGQA